MHEISFTVEISVSDPSIMPFSSSNDRERVSKFNCTCGETFDSEREARVHLREESATVKTTGADDLVCPSCWEEALNFQRTASSGVGIFECDSCGHEDRGIQKLVQGEWTFVRLQSL